MGLFDRSSSSSTVQNIYETSTEVDQVDQSGSSGLNLSNVSGVSLSEQNTVNYVDPGALEAAKNIAAGAYGLGSQALNLSGSSLQTVAKVNSDSLGLLAGLVSGAIDNSKTLTRDALASNKESVQQAISGFSTLAKQNSASSDDRVQTVALYAFAALAAVFVLPALFRGGKA